MFRVRVKNDSQDTIIDLEEERLVFGRSPSSPGKPVIIQDPFFSRDQLWVEPCPAGIRVGNLSSNNPVHFPNAKALNPGSQAEFQIPIRISVGQTTIEISSPSRQLKNFHFPTPEEINLDGATPVDPKQMSYLDRGIDPMMGTLSLESGHPSLEKVLTWLDAINQFQSTFVDRPDFYSRMSQSIVQMCDLDMGMVVLKRDNQWKMVGCHTANDTVSPRYSRSLLQHVEEKKQTFFQDLSLLQSPGMSLAEVEAAVVSPIFGLKQEVAGALYGCRIQNVLKRGGINRLEAQLVQLLAGSVGAGLAREEAVRSKVHFEQFFSSDLVRELERRPDLLTGREQEITVLFSDLRGFTALSNLLKPVDICKLLQDVMERLSADIMNEGGVIVDYAGDGILAMWNAPVEQKDHADRACRAGLAMLRHFPELNANWKSLLQGLILGLGVGVNTGAALVGNTGSQRKFKYGPLGLTVNLASRVQDATKSFSLPMLVTTSTRNRLTLGGEFRKLGKILLPGISDPVEVHEPAGADPSPAWFEQKKKYEEALDSYENKDWAKVIRLLMGSIESRARGEPQDQAAVKLIRRTWECLENNPKDFLPILDQLKK
ncbi:MAG: adenylate/guanylate cyclase domain-containing protein [Gemmataceae bacterium]|nr:adenylate/guanylate cyclase domain-containing protein [Gemmataceae bacterium]